MECRADMPGNATVDMLNLLSHVFCVLFLDMFMS